MRSKSDEWGVTVLAHLAFANFHPHKDTQHRSQNILLPYHTACEHYLVLANHCDRLKRGFTY